LNLHLLNSSLGSGLCWLAFVEETEFWLCLEHRDDVSISCWLAWLTTESEKGTSLIYYRRPISVLFIKKKRNNAEKRPEYSVYSSCTESLILFFEKIKQFRRIQFKRSNQLLKESILPANYCGSEPMGTKEKPTKELSNSESHAKEISLKLVTGIRLAAKCWGPQGSDVKVLALHGYFSSLIVSISSMVLCFLCVHDS
jgi:hypothetical protein